MTSEKRIQETYERLKLEAEASGYNLNPDEVFTKSLIEGLLTNEDRYGYWSCPCRLADGEKQLDLDIICPCDYRDADLDEYGACYCALYVSDEVRDGKQELQPVPERRPETPAQLKAPSGGAVEVEEGGLPVWRCRLCAVTCARARLRPAYARSARRKKTGSNSSGWAAPPPDRSAHRKPRIASAGKRTHGLPKFLMTFGSPFLLPRSMEPCRKTRHANAGAKRPAA